MKRNTQLQRNALDRLEFTPRLDASKFGVKATNGIFILTGKANSNAEIYAESQSEGIRFFTGLLYGSAIAVASWLTVGGVVWWVTR